MTGSFSIDLCGLPGHTDEEQLCQLLSQNLTPDLDSSSQEPVLAFL